MSGEKTEQPTAKKIKDARKKGSVLKSQDITQALVFLTATMVLLFGGQAFVSELRALLQQFFRPEVLSGTLLPDQLLSLTGMAFQRLFIVVLPLALGVMIVAGATTFLQVQPLLSFDVIKPKFEKLNPIQGFQNIFFKAKTYVELAKNLLKFTLVLVVAYFLIRDSLGPLILSSQLSVAQSGELAGTLLSRFLLRVGGLFALIGAADFFLQRSFYTKGLKMSKQEVLDEYKQDEGDQHVKQARKHLHQELSQQAAVRTVPKAAAVVVNPTHLAIAIQYDDKFESAPSVCAKGQDDLAQNIIGIAKEHHVPIIRNVPLAHSLYKVGIGDEIPEDLYDAVAEVLNWVYSLEEENKK